MIVAVRDDLRRQQRVVVLEDAERKSRSDVNPYTLAILKPQAELSIC